MPTAAIIGAGPVGCLTAVGLYQRGYDVTMYEIRPEEAFSNTGTDSRSINLAISTRGLTALSSVDPILSETILENSVPMRARMIHSKPTTSKVGAAEEQLVEEDRVRLESQLYSTKGQCIHSVSRNLLNRLLLDEVIKCGIKICWSHKLLRTDLGNRRKQKTTATTSSPSHSNQVELLFDNQQVKGFRSWTDLIVGCDGHHSKVRGELSRAIELDFSQHFIDNYYSELHIPVTKSGDFALDPNHLHIWPRHDFMLIALANQDKTFTSTLFAPKKIYSKYLQDEPALLGFFRREFPDALKLIGEERLVKDLMGRKPSPLGTIECNPYHYQGKLIVLGDASHAMVPFYGQGLNCGLEDVRIMLALLDKHLETRRSIGQQGTEVDEEAMSTGSSTSTLSSPSWPVNHIRVDSGAVISSRRESQTNKAGEHEDQILALLRERAFDEYSSTRHADLVAISQLAMDNFEEMSSKVVSMPYRIRKQIDSILVGILPQNWWNSLYTLVTFSNIGYHEAQQREAKQKQILNAIGLSSFATFSVAGVFSAYRFARNIDWIR